MKKWLYIFGAFALAGSIQSLVACSSSDAHQGPSVADFEALQSQVTTLQTTVTNLQATINGLDGAVLEVQTQLGPRVVQQAATNERRKEGSHGSQRIGQFHDFAYTGPDCTGDRYILGSVLSAAGAQQGFVFMYRLADDTRGTESPYMMVAPETPRTEFTWTSTEQRGGCQNRVPVMTTQGYIVVPNDEAVCGVPEKGIPAAMWPEGSPPTASLHKSTTHEVWTDKSCLTVVPSDALPKITVGME